MATRAVCCFTHLTTTDWQWRNEDYSVKKFLDGLKGREINKYARIPVDSGRRRYLSNANASDAIKWFGEMAARFIHDVGIRAPMLVPFPNSKCVVGDRRSRTA